MTFFGDIRYSIAQFLAPQRYIVELPRPAIRNVHGSNLIGAEVGVAQGMNARSILKYLDIKKLYLIDLKNMFKGSLPPNAVFIEKPSIQAVDEIPEPLDFVYIDANHTYEACKKDIEIYYDKVKKGGLVGGHDFSEYDHPDVNKTVVEFCFFYNLHLFSALNDWWIVK